MAQKVKIILVDDVDGGAAEETVRFGLDGINYEIDLSTEHAAELRDVLSPYVEAGRRSTRRSAGNKSAAVKNHDASLIRSWAQENGYNVGNRGRIHADVVDAFYEAKGA
ncbi:MAG: Lsr2 family protein [Acidobacteria bacterium]|nr:Lsr2 family protein [Acidobacteriota bacterium]